MASNEIIHLSGIYIYVNQGVIYVPTYSHIGSQYIYVI